MVGVVITTPCNIMQKKELRKQFLLSILDKLLFALGAGNGDLALTLGYPHLLMAAGAVIIAVILIFQLLEKQQEFPILIVSLVDVPGQRPEYGKKHTGIRDGGKNQLDHGYGHQHGQESETQTYTQNCHIQFICAVPACHKLPQTHTKLSEKSIGFVTKTVHILLLGDESFLYYSQKQNKFNLKMLYLTEC